MDVANMVCTANYTTLTATWCRSECCAPSGLNFEARGGSVVHYYLSNHLLWGHQVAVNMTWALFVVKCGNTKGVPTLLFSRLVRCSAHGRSFCTTMVYIYRSCSKECPPPIFGLTSCRSKFTQMSTHPGASFRSALIEFEKHSLKRYAHLR